MSQSDSFLQKYFKGWSFRSSTPDFEQGETIEVFLTDGTGGPVARVGDTIIEVPDAPEEMIDDRVTVRITDFDPSDHRGTAEFVEKVGESAF